MRTKSSSKDIQSQNYDELVKKMTPNSRMLRGYVRAFWVGGTICCIGQALNLLGNILELTVMTSPMFTSMVLIFIGTTLTGIGIYDRIGRYAGAGSIVPITGFANSIAASAIEFRREGLILGLGSRLFTVAGPVLAYGISTSILAGLIHWLIRRIW